MLDFNGKNDPTELFGFQEQETKRLEVELSLSDAVPKCNLSYLKSSGKPLVSKFVKFSHFEVVLISTLFSTDLLFY